MAPQEPVEVHYLVSRASTARRAAVTIAVITVLVTVVSAIVMRLVDQEDFPSIGLALWWAVQTVTTVGYGDAVPQTVLGRSVGALLMVVGIGFITVVTASITAVFVESARRRIRGETDPELIERRFDALETRFDGLEALLGGERRGPDTDR